MKRKRKTDPEKNKKNKKNKGKSVRAPLRYLVRFDDMIRFDGSCL